MKQLKLDLKSKKLAGDIRISGSKSISNRVLVMNALARANTSFTNLSTAHDTLLMDRILKQVEICSKSGIPMVIDAGNTGTVFRFLTALLAITEGLWLLTGSDRMKKRPVGALVNVLKQLGADISYSGKDGYPPLLIKCADFNGGVVVLDATISSQYVTALMMIGPHLSGGLKIRFDQKPVSAPYISMTMKIMQHFGIAVQWDDNLIAIPEGNYQLEEYKIEPDWSSASYWYQMASLSEECDLFLTGFQSESLQGDSICPVLFEQLGVKTVFEQNGIRLKKQAVITDHFNHDFSDYPDLVPAIMATCAAKNIPASFRGIEHLRVKESDRIESLKTELSKIGARLNQQGKVYNLLPAGPSFTPEELVFDTYHDHRLAMCLSPLFFKYGSVKINDPDTVDKSYPTFWDHLKQADIANVEKY